MDLFQSDNNDFAFNTFSYNGISGIYVGTYYAAGSGSDHNKFLLNNITRNGGGAEFTSGIWVENSNDTLFCHNNVIGNIGQQAYCLNTTNSWDKGYPAGGNFWSDDLDTDLHSGRYQNQTGADGILDHAYVINLLNKDNYPLASLWPSDCFRVDWRPAGLAQFVSSSTPREREPVAVTAYVMINQRMPDSVTLSYYNSNGTERWSTPLLQQLPGDYGEYIWTCEIPPQLGWSTVTFSIQATSGGISMQKGPYSYNVQQLLPTDINGDGKVNLIDTFRTALDFGKTIPWH